ncbi:hypothetical protein Aph01nite_31470 [Acrocarpospora phusangensis]|uniref:Peptidyl-prolyl cis-trans isomerase n=1 Tax=Acrocarpospora phusangensis TaxID=1070424 RepID=A0A919QEL1_9ACTN|nr:FKBP-type peptidyl-prolyl cis-trans isomerase [Acrocarpospora phusangensis]GIH24837.1 hypothetical protein Aph01nite_31470 [Acrocarpospora phusangensis]
MRRLLPFVVSVVSLLSGCGQIHGTPGTALSVTGDFGTRPTVVLPSGPPPAAPVVEVLAEGRGPVVREGQVVVTHADIRLWRDGRPYMSTHDLRQPTTVTLDGQHVSGTWAAALVGRRAGSRVTLVSPAAQGFGPAGMAPSGVSPSETLVIVFDIIGGYAPTANARHVRTPTDAGPTLPVVGGFPPFPSSFPKSPPRALTVRTLRRGSGPPAKPGSTVVVQYVTTPWGATTPTDASYARGGPNGFLLAENSVPPGWVAGLTGVPAGSRVLLVAPPKPGFTSTTGGVIVPQGVFVTYVIDILDVFDPARGPAG